MDQTVREVFDSERLEYSNVASRFSGGLLETFVLSGRWEAGGEAALYAAPERITGDLDGVGSEFVELSWDELGTAAVQGFATLQEVRAFLQNELQAADSAEAQAGD
jgi:hypothetical protein